MYEGGPAEGALETTISVPEIVTTRAEKPERRRFMLSVVENAHPIAANTFEVSVTKPYVGFTFVPGQSMKFCFGDDTHGRSFTIVSAPHEPYLTFVFRGSDSELKKSLTRLQAGERVSMLDAKGNCTYPEEPGTPVVMFAGGVGVAPFVSMLRHAANDVHDGREFTLLYANRTPDAVAYKTELDVLSSSGQVRLSTRYLITAPDAGQIPGFESGHFSAEHVLPFLAEGKPLPLFYAVGSREMVESVQKILQARDVPETHIRLKIFKGYEGVDGA